MVKIYHELLRLVDLTKAKVDLEVIEDISNTYGSVDTSPKGLPLMEDVVRDFLMGTGNYSEGDTVLCLGRLSDFWSDPTYNRPNEINYNKCLQNIRNVGGFSHNASDVVSGFLRTNERDQGKVVLTKGNHRGTMKNIVDNSVDSRLAVSLKLHKLDTTLEEAVVIEAKDHTRDCSYRAPQQGDSKFKSNYYANEEWALELYNFAAEFKIGIAETNPEAEFVLPSHSYLSRSRRMFMENSVRTFLTGFTEKKCCKKILGNTIIAGSGFIKFFGNTVDEVDKKYNIDSFGDMLDFYFHHWKSLMETIDEPDPANVTQEQITESKAWNNAPGNEPGIARFVFLYNAYCKRKRYELKQTAKNVIPFDGGLKSCWSKFLDTVSEPIRPSIYSLATTKFF